MSTDVVSLAWCSIASDTYPKRQRRCALGLVNVKEEMVYGIKAWVWRKKNGTWNWCDAGGNWFGNEPNREWAMHAATEYVRTQEIIAPYPPDGGPPR